MASPYMDAKQSQQDSQVMINQDDELSQVVNPNPVVTVPQ